MAITNTGLMIIGLGLAIPSTIIILANLVEKLMLGDLYKIDFSKISIIYLVALIGWFVIFGINL